MTETAKSTLEVSNLSIAQIRKDGGTQHRLLLSPSVVDQYAALLKDEIDFPPLRVWFDGTYYWLSDGFHRLAAAEKAGFKYVSADIHHGSIEDARWDSYSANSQHGLRRKRSDILSIVEQVLQHPNAASLSNVQLAKHLGIPEATFRRWRKRVSSSPGDDGLRVVKRRGTTYTLQTNQIGNYSRHGHLGQKSKSQIRQDLSDMQRLGSPELTRLLNLIDTWLFGTTPATECLIELQHILASH